MKILLPVDGSTYSRRACQYLVKHRAMFGHGAELTLVHVDPPLLARVATALGGEATAQYHRDNSERALKPARGMLQRAGIAFGEEQHVGDPGSLLAHRAKRGRYDLVVMGSHGHGAWKSLVLGSVTSKVMSGCEVPVLVVR